MDSKQAVEKLHIIEKLASCELEARYVRQIIELIERQEELFPGGDPKYTIESLREQLETQAQVLEARDKIIVLVSRQLQDSTDQIKKLKCCGNCRNWLNRPDQMICTVQKFNVSQWCYCEEWRRGWNDDGHQTGD